MMYRITGIIAFITLFIIDSMAQELFVDERDGQPYNTIVVNDSCVWMAENLRYNLPDAKVCAGSERGDDYEIIWNPITGDTCAWYYNYEQAQNVCPSGWHLPREEEWEMLIDFLGGWKKAGGKLKQHGAWERDDTEGIKTSGFNALPLGYINHKGNLVNTFCEAIWWSCSKIKTSLWGMSALCFELNDGSNRVESWDIDIDIKLSVRCVKDY